MARRAPREDKPYNPIEAALVQRVAQIAAPLQEAPPPLPPVVEPVATVPPPRELETPAPKKVMNREKRVVLTWDEEVALNELLAAMSSALATPVKLSNLLRACVILLRHAEGSVDRRAAQASGFARPSNNDLAAIAYFEHRLAKILQLGIKDSSYID